MTDRRPAGLQALALLALGAACDGAPRSSPPPNRFGIRHVVLVSIDTLRADRLGCYGYRIEGRSPSPRLDLLAAQSAVLERHFSAASTTLSSHTSLMTGTWPHTHGVPRNGFRVSDENLMLAELLGAAGFLPACFLGAAPLSESVNFPQGFLHRDFRASRVADRSPSGYQRRADEVTDAALGWLDRRYGAAVDESLFLFVHYFDPHAPYEAPPPFAGLYRRAAPDESGRYPDPRSAEAPLLARKLMGLDGMDGGPGDAALESGFLAALERQRPQQLTWARELEAEYCAEISFVDRELARLLDGLRERGVLDEALVVVTSDHGETLYEHTPLFSHGESVFDSEIHTPLILRFPGGRFAGVRSQHLVSNVDVAPSLLEALGLELPARVEGVSFLGALEGGLAAREPVFAEATKPSQPEIFEQDPLWPNRRKFECVSDGRHKLVRRTADGIRRLYDLQADPLEQHDLLAAGTAFEERLGHELELRLEAWRAAAAPLPSGPVDAVDQLEALRALGYLGDDR